VVALVVVALVGLTTSLVSVAPSATAEEVTTTQGQEFWLAFQPNASEIGASLQLNIAGQAGVTGQVTIPGLAISHDFAITAEGIAVVDLELDAKTSESNTGQVENKAVHVQASGSVSVYGMNRALHSTDAFTAYPVGAAGTSFRLLAYNGGISQDQVAVVAVDQPAQVTITLPGGESYTETVSQGQVYSLSADSLTGAQVTSDQPVNVSSGNLCTYVPTGVPACDHLVEQIPPVSAWGQEYVTFPLVGRTQDTFRILADRDHTVVTITKTTPETVTLQAGEFYELLSGEPMTITATEPIEVAQYSNGQMFDNVLSDPFMVIVQPQDQGLMESTFAAPTTGFRSNFVNVSVTTADRDSVRLDGQPVPATAWVEIPGSDFSGAGLAVEAGNHHITADVPIQTIVYGFDYADSYGYPGGGRMARIADIVSLTVDPETAGGPVGQELCVTATLLDEDGVGVAGANLAAALTGVVTDTQTVVTGADGRADICQTVNVGGAATLTVTQGDLTDTATLTWHEQVVAVRYVDDDAAGAVVTPVGGTPTELSGQSGAAVGFTTASAQAGVPAGYDFVGLDNVEFFDTDAAQTQTITIHLRHHHTVTTLETQRVIRYTGAGAQTPTEVVQTQAWQVDTDHATGVVTYSTEQGYAAVDSPTLAGYVAGLTRVAATDPVLATQQAPANTVVEVAYAPPIADTGSNLEPILIGLAAGLFLCAGVLLLVNDQRRQLRI
jgi:hypothetical protein